MSSISGVGASPSLNSLISVSNLITVDSSLTMDNTAQTSQVDGAQQNTGTGAAAAHHHHHHGGGGGAFQSALSSDGSNTSTSGLNELLSSLGIDPSELAGLLSNDPTATTAATGAAGTTAGASGITSAANVNPSASTSATTATAAATAAAQANPTDFVSQLKNLIAQYGNKGNLFDGSL
jgi:hypothetical protein